VNEPEEFATEITGCAEYDSIDPNRRSVQRSIHGDVTERFDRK
jgi:hypothetical protein